MASITSANAVITISVPGVFTTPFQLQGFSADNIYDAPELETVQTAMGVDGRLSGGFVYNAVSQTFSVQADSETNAFFETWMGRMRTLKDVYVGEGTTRLVSVGTTYVMKRGFLTTAHVMPAAARILQPRRYTIQWQSVTPSPI